MTFFTDVTPFQVAMALLAVGAIEYLLCRFAPEEMVGPQGRLLKREMQG